MDAEPEWRIEKRMAADVVPGDRILSPHTGRMNTVGRVERPAHGILRVVLKTGVLLDYNPEHGVVRQLIEGAA